MRILSKKHVEDQWTCSHTNAHFFDLTPAPAYRVRWAKDQRAFDRGDVTTVVFPFRTDDFWGHSAKATNGRVGLGHLNCFDKTAPEDLDGDKLVVRVSGLYPDGEEYVKPPARPRRRMRCGTAWVFSRRAAVAPSPRYTARQWQWLGLLGFALLGFFAARRRLRGVTRENSWRLRAVQDARLPHILATVYAVCSTLLAVGLTAASAGTTTFAVAGVVVLASTVTGAAVAVALADR